MMYNKKHNRGFTLLIAVLMGSVLLAIGYAIYNILSKEVILSSSGRDSQFAFYAADSGIECALYWDNKQDAFSTSSAQANLSCGGSAVPITRTFDAGTGIYSNTFSFPLGTGGIGAPCANVVVKRLYSPTRTTVESSGYNTCDTTNRNITSYRTRRINICHNSIV